MGLGLNSDGIRDPVAYARAALDAEFAICASTAHGRNEQLNRSAFVLGQLVGGGYLGRFEVEHGLFTAGEAAGYVGKDGPGAARATIKSGLDKGIRQPRDLGSGEAPAATIHILRPKPQLSGVAVPDWTEPTADPNDGGKVKPKFTSVGSAEPRAWPDEARRHVYRRDGEAVRVKVKKSGGSFVNWYRVRRPDTGEVGWQAQKPDGYVPCPYVPPGCAPPFDPDRRGQILVWSEGEKDADALHGAGFLAFTFGGTADVPDLSDLLAGHNVVVCVDNDEAGRKSIARKVGAALAAGASMVRLVQFPDLPEGGDAADFLAAGGDAEAFLDRAERIDPAAWAAEHGDRAAGAGAGADDDGFGPKAGEPRASSVLFYGDREPEPAPWLIRDILPQTQVAILAGQHSAGKTFAGVDLSVSTMTGLPFAGHEVERKGAVLWLAAEGLSEISIRLKAAAVHRLGRDGVGELPFAYQVSDVPTLLAADALPRLLQLVEDTKAGLAARFPGVDLALIVLDTLNSAAGFTDENSASEAQRAFNVLRQLSDKAGALVLVVDHYGKASETGVRGSSAKAGAADAILAALADKDEATGKVDNRRLAVTKLRGAATGKVIPFALKAVPIDPFGNTHCGVEWDLSAEAETAAERKAKRPAWAGNARILKDAIERAMIDTGRKLRPFTDGPEVKAVSADKARAEFYAAYPGEGAEAKRKGFRRLLDGALAKGLLASREVGGVDYLWFVVEGEP